MAQEWLLSLFSVPLQAHFLPNVSRWKEGFCFLLASLSDGKYFILPHKQGSLHNKDDSKKCTSYKNNIRTAVKSKAFLWHLESFVFSHYTV